MSVTYDLKIQSSIKELKAQAKERKYLAAKERREISAHEKELQALACAEDKLILDDPSRPKVALDCGEYKICDSEGEIVGHGVFVNDGELLTTSHVIQALPSEIDATFNEKVYVLDFGGLGAQEYVVNYDDTKEDVCLLSCITHDTSGMGFKIGRLEDVHNSCEIRTPDSQPVTLQVVNPWWGVAKNNNFTYGHSGMPLFQNNKVVGIYVGFQRDFGVYALMSEKSRYDPEEWQVVKDIVLCGRIKYNIRSTDDDYDQQQAYLEQERAEARKQKELEDEADRWAALQEEQDQLDAFWDEYNSDGGGFEENDKADEKYNARVEYLTGVVHHTGKPRYTRNGPFEAVDPSLISLDFYQEKRMNPAYVVCGKKNKNKAKEIKPGNIIDEEKPWTITSELEAKPPQFNKISFGLEEEEETPPAPPKFVPTQADLDAQNELIKQYEMNLEKIAKFERPTGVLPPVQPVWYAAPTALPSLKELSLAREKEEIANIEAEILSYNKSGVYLKNVVTLTALESAKFPARELKKQLRLKELKQLREKSNYLARAAEMQERAGKEREKIQKLLNDRAVETAKLQERLAELEEKLKTAQITNLDF